MNYLELRNKLEQFTKYSGVNKIPRTSIVNKGFPGNFNISFGEGPFLEKFENYLDNPESYNFSVIQQVIRVNDFTSHFDDTHLLLFDMADISGFVGEINVPDDKRNDIASFTVKKTFEFLINELGLKPEKFIISYLAGGKVEELTGGKYKFNKYIEADPFIKIAKEFGISESQFIPDKTRTTLLALNFTPPVSWGYRNEILYKADNLSEPLDIASIENLLWRPIYKNGTVVDLVRWENFWSFQVVGIERLLMLINNSDKAYEADHILPLITKFSEKTGNSDFQLCRVTIELLRVFHRIVADMKSFNVMSSSRKEKLIPFRRKFLQNCEKLGFDYKNGLKELLILNGKLQPCYPELLSDIESQADEMIKWLGRGKIQIKNSPK
ncbi:hypothetical protein HY623_01995 [Candidatus Uhrbacteria bacterium]|nr:hypothetical protein [Candidatus Uhrbacteria bacterium]